MRDTPCYHRRRFRFEALTFTRRRHDRGSPEPRTFASMSVVSSLVRPPQPAIAGHFAARLPRLRRWFRSLLAVALLLNAVAAFAQDSDTVTLNFVNADIDAVVKAVGEITGRNFLVDPRVKGTVNIVSARPVAKALDTMFTVP